MIFPSIRLFPHLFDVWLNQLASIRSVIKLGNSLFLWSSDWFAYCACYYFSWLFFFSKITLTSCHWLRLHSHDVAVSFLNFSLTFSSDFCFCLQDARGNDVDLSIYKGKVLLIVNVASQWYRTLLFLMHSLSQNHKISYNFVWKFFSCWYCVMSVVCY